MTKCINQCLQGLFPNFRFQLAFPNRDAMPAHRCKFALFFLVSDSISFYLIPPELHIGLGQNIILASFMSVSKTAVHEDDRPILPEYKIRMPGKPWIIQPIAKPTTKQKLPYQQFRLRIPSFYC